MFCLCQPEPLDIFQGREPGKLPEKRVEITAVQADVSCNILYLQRIGNMVLNIGNRLVDISIPFCLGQDIPIGGCNHA